MRRLWHRCAALLGGLGLAACALAQPANDEERPGTLQLREATAVLQPEGGPAVERVLQLPHRWDDEFPGRAGRAQYRLTLPPATSAEPMGLLFARVGNQFTVKVNGKQITARGQLGEPGFDAAKTPRIVIIRPDLLYADQPNELLIELTTQALRWGGLTNLRYGPEHLVESEYEVQRRWRHTALLVYCVALALMGAMALALWVRLRDPLFACFGVAALLGIVRNLDRIWADIPVPWPLWGMVTAAAYAWHLALMFLFALMALNYKPKALYRTLLAYLPVALMLAVASFTLGLAWPWTLALGLLVPLGLAVWGAVLYQAWRGQAAQRTAWLLSLAGAVALAAGLYDLGLVRLGLGSSSRSSLTPHAMFFFVLIMAGIIVDRYARTAVGLKTLNQTLDQQVRQREAALVQTYDQLQTQQAAQATLIERQRIMRDLHDGVGAQLVGLLNLLRRPDARPEVLQEHVQAALDEMRLAVDSMQITDGDLTTTLATLRYRVQARVQAAGLEMHWAVDDLPPIPSLSPRAVLQVQRIVLEALTNVLKHAKASAIWISCSLADDQSMLVLEVADNGIGLPPESSTKGQGMDNMRLRAQSIGARWALLARDGAGTRVRLELPLAP